jgi:hypothetical protein
VLVQGKTTSCLTGIPGDGSCSLAGGCITFTFQSSRQVSYAIGSTTYNQTFTFAADNRSATGIETGCIRGSGNPNIDPPVGCGQGYNWYATYSWTWTDGTVLTQTQTACTSAMDQWCVSTNADWKYLPPAGQMWTYARGQCSAPIAAGFVGTWQNNEQKCITLQQSAYKPNQLVLTIETAAVIWPGIEAGFKYPLAGEGLPDRSPATNTFCYLDFYPLQDQPYTSVEYESVFPTPPLLLLLLDSSLSSSSSSLYRVYTALLISPMQFFFFI